MSKVIRELQEIIKIRKVADPYFNRASFLYETNPVFTDYDAENESEKSAFSINKYLINHNNFFTAIYILMFLIVIFSLVTSYQILKEAQHKTQIAQQWMYVNIQQEQKIQSLKNSVTNYQNQLNTAIHFMQNHIELNAELVQENEKEISETVINNHLLQVEIDALQTMNTEFLNNYHNLSQQFEQIKKYVSDS